MLANNMGLLGLRIKVKKLKKKIILLAAGNFLTLLPSQAIHSSS